VQVAKVSTQRLEGISMMEAQNQAMILLNLSGPVNYDVTMTSVQARSWLYVELNPAIRDRDKVLEKMTANSTLVGQVLTTEKGDGKIEVAIEVLPRNISYTVEQDGTAVVIKITKAQ
jgi:hypothetical protein